MEQPLWFGLEVLLRGAKVRAAEMGVQQGAEQAGVQEPTRLSTTPKADVLNKALEIRRRVAAKAAQGSDV